MSKYTNALYPDKINDLVDNEGNLNPSMVPGGVELAGNSLVIPEQPGPEPVAVIDGVAYFHKQEFDLEEILPLFGPGTKEDGSTKIDVTTGDEIAVTNIACLINVPYGTETKYSIRLSLEGKKNDTWASPNGFIIYKGEGYGDVNFTSRAFTVVDTQEAVTDNTKICLPTCSAYYGFLSEDGKTFISYYNLKSDGIPNYIDSIKRGNAVFPLKDLSASNTKLYKHVITVLTNSANISYSITLVTTTDATATRETLYYIMDELNFDFQGNHKIFTLSIKENTYGREAVLTGRAGIIYGLVGKFATQSFDYIVQGNWPTAPTVGDLETYTADSIDVSTGNIIPRTKTATYTFASITDTVTEL